MNESEWTGRRKVTILAAKPRWLPEVQPIEIADEEIVWAWRAFFALVNGQANTFRLPAVRKQQVPWAGVVVHGGGQAGFALVTRGWAPNATQLRAGQFITVNDQLLQLVADPLSNASGIATLTFRPYLRIPAADGAPVVIGVPTCLVSLASDVTGWDDEEDGFYTIPAFSCREAF